ncbi:MAG TPA: hypothetical protein VLZ05_22695 [Mycobacterium sp.]|nr:hypothetical protein [Mycobacterium sp.]
MFRSPADEFALQTLVTGRYHDRFERVDGRWRFSFRDLTLIDKVGDVSHHLTHPIAPPLSVRPQAGA